MMSTISPAAARERLSAMVSTCACERWYRDGASPSGTARERVSDGGDGASPSRGSLNAAEGRANSHGAQDAHADAFTHEGNGDVSYSVVGAQGGSMGARAAASHGTYRIHAGDPRHSQQGGLVAYWHCAQVCRLHRCRASATSVEVSPWRG